MIVAILFGGHEYCASDFAIQREKYPYYILEIPIKGLCAFQVDGSEYTLRSGVIGGFAPGIPHAYRCDANDPMEHFFFAFAGTAAEELFAAAQLDRRAVRTVPRHDTMMHLAGMMLDKARQRSEQARRICGYYLRILLLELADAGSVVSDDSPAMRTYRRCRAYIDTHYSRMTQPAQAAAACGVTVRHMSRLFKQFDTVTPHEAIMQLKMNKAGVLLLTAPLSVSRIAAVVGYTDPYHFSRNFKRFHGCSPRQYRHRHS